MAKTKNGIPESFTIINEDCLCHKKDQGASVSIS